MAKLNNQDIRDVRVFSRVFDDFEWRVSDHFKLKEFACKDGSGIILLHPALVDGLERIRVWAGAPVIVTSAYRTLSYNKTIKDSAPNSMHPHGMAADIIVTGKTPREVQEYAMKLGFGGVGCYETFTHVDVWAEGRRWSKAK